MISDDLKVLLNAEQSADYVISNDYKLVYMNPVAVLFTPKAEPGSSFLSVLCGKKTFCNECPIKSNLSKEKTKVSKDSLCAFANVSFSWMENENVFISRWNDKEDPLDMLTELDMKTAIANMGGSKEAFNSVLEVYYHEGIKKPEIISEHYNARDYYNLRIEVHGLKSTSYVIGNNHLGDFAKALEFACRDIEANEDTVKVESAKVFIDEELDNLIEEYKSLIKKLAAVYGDDPDSIFSKETQKGVFRDELSAPDIPENEEALEHLKKAHELLESFELEDSTNHLLLAMDGISSELINEYIKSIIKLINDFNYDKASDKLAKWLNL